MRVWATTMNFPFQLMAYVLSGRMRERIVIDTNVCVSAVLSSEGAARSVVRLALKEQVIPVFGNALFSAYEDVLGRKQIFEKSVIDHEERLALFHALLSVSDWTSIHFLWRPNPKDEADNHVMELAIASGASAIVTSNIRDFSKGELVFPNLIIATPCEWLGRRTQT
jgi:putative PIN family toxin of toxin-antitoxin system